MAFKITVEYLEQQFQKEFKYLKNTGCRLYERIELARNDYQYFPQWGDYVVYEAEKYAENAIIKITLNITLTHIFIWNASIDYFDYCKGHKPPICFKSKSFKDIIQLVNKDYANHIN